MGFLTFQKTPGRLIQVDFCSSLACSRLGYKPSEPILIARAHQLQGASAAVSSSCA